MINDNDGLMEDISYVWLMWSYENIRQKNKHRNIFYCLWHILNVQMESCFEKINKIPQDGNKSSVSYASAAASGVICMIVWLNWNLIVHTLYI